MEFYLIIQKEVHALHAEYSICFTRIDNMSQKTRLSIGLLLVLTLVCGAGLYIGTKKTSHVVSSADKTIDLKNTTWELVEYTEGSDVKNMVGTDWILQFGAKDGFFRLCDTHLFTFYTFKDVVTFDFSEKNDTSCQDTHPGAHESTLFDFLKSNPRGERVSDASGKFKEVLTLVSGDKKLVFIPRTALEVSDSSNTKHVLVDATVCSPTTTECALFAGTFHITSIDQKDSVPMILTTDIQGQGSIELPKGSYQVTMEKGPKGETFSSIIFSITDTKKGPYVIELEVQSKK